MRRLSLAAVAAALLGSLALVPAPAGAVAHGVAASQGQFPFAVKLTMTHIPRPDGTFYDSACSGALISPTYVITAGHCFHDVNRNRVSGPVPYATVATMATANTTTNAGISRNVVAVRQYPNADVAVAQLDAPTTVAPIALTTARPARGQILTLAGWGATSSVNPAPSTQLYWGRVKISSVSSSTLAVTGTYPAKDTSACLYDSGAPYFVTPPGSAPRLVSTEVDGPSCPHTTPETTARTDTAVAWIRGVVPDLPT